MSNARDRFSLADWERIRELPSLVVAAASGAERVTGLALTREIMTGLHAIVDGGQHLRHNALIQAVFEDYKHEGWGEARTLELTERPASLLLPAAANAASEVTAILSRRADFAEEYLEFREWLWSIADEVVNSVASGGFLGLGGRRVSDGERAFLSALAQALQVERG